nr:family 43 glycosylhydrolase [uncultured Clostridium sp.]
MDLIEAVKAKNKDLVKQILDGDPTAVKREGREALFQAASEGDLTVLQYLTEYSAVNLGEKDQWGRSALFYGVQSGNLSVVRYLTEQVGLSPLYGDLEGETPFDLAHKLGNSGVEEYFAEIAGAVCQDTYHNPVITGFSPDPSIVRVGEDYYMVHSSFCYFPCIPISHSRDLVNWKIIGHAITRPEYAGLDDLESGRGYWAADISYYEGRFYIAATYRLNDVKGLRRKQMITSSLRPEGPYEEPVFLDVDGIDPSVFNDDDGRRYMLLNRGARIMELSRDGKQLLSRPELLWYGDLKVTPEGPHLLKKDGYYYLIQAEGGTGMGHSVTVARSRNLMGPYDPCPGNPILTQRDPNALMQCCGHGKLVETQGGQWFMVYHCSRMPDHKHAYLGRETVLDPVEWNADGWPVINGGRGPGAQHKRPLFLTDSPDCGHNIEEGILKWTDLGWVTPRTPYINTIRIDNSSLYLRGTKEDLSSVYCRSIYVRRQKFFCFSAECKVEAVDSGMQTEMGLTSYYDENSFIKFGISGATGNYGILLSEYRESGYIREEWIPLEESRPFPLSLRVETKEMDRIFQYRTGDQDWKLAGICRNTNYLTSEGVKKGKRFTGAMVGVYVKGEAEGRFEEFCLYH